MSSVRSHFVCAVRDIKLGAFMQPFFVPALGVAERSFSDEVNRKDSPMNQHPSDYELFYIADYAEDTGSFVGKSSPEFLCSATSLVQVKD